MATGRVWAALVLLVLLAAGCGGARQVADRAEPAAWGVSRVAAVQAVSREVTAANPIMENPKYAPAESEYGVEVGCRRRSARRYLCSWRAVNTYSVLSGRAGVRFVHARPRVELRQTSCRRHVGPGEDSALVRCAASGFESARSAPASTPVSRIEQSVKSGLERNLMTSQPRTEKGSAWSTHVRRVRCVMSSGHEFRCDVTFMNGSRRQVTARVRPDGVVAVG